LRLIGQIGSRVIEELDHLAEVDHRIGDVLVLAELMIGGAQVGKSSAKKRPDRAGCCAYCPFLPASIASGARVSAWEFAILLRGNAL
jgi:hypothetical protein